jgi:membrane protein YdbS with pleckstrin-like domain
VDSLPDLDFRFRAVERRVLDLLAVPSAPEPPEGSPDSIRVFHAGRNYYVWSVLVWASRCVAAFAGLALVSVAGARNISSASGSIQIALASLLGLGWIVFILTAIVTFIARRLNYRLRWYIVTDRSLRIRSGVFQVHELTMTYGNIQEIRVTSGPLQHALGLADVEVQAAGGGGEKHDRGGHTGRFEGLSNANAIRDLMVEQLRRYRDSGLGDAPLRAAPGEPSEIAAARDVLAEARALRASLAREA